VVDINNHIEVAAISDSCQILSDTLNLVEKHIRPGQSVMELDSIAENYILSCNAKPAFKGYDGFPATLTVSIDDEIESLFCVALLLVNAKTGTLGLALDINSAVKPLLVKTTIASASIFLASFTDVAAKVCQSLSCFRLFSK